MPNEKKRIFILGGTAEARALAGLLDADPRFHPLTSLAGVTATRAAIPAEVRTGGFGGAEGLREFIGRDGMALVADATHPFAAQISAHAVTACAAAGVPLLRLERPEWKPQPGDNWVHAPDSEAAAKAVPKAARALVTVGRKEIGWFFAHEDIHVVARMIEPPGIPVPGNAEVILARPPFTLEQEKALMRDRDITVLVAKNSGGAATYAKIEAARELGLPVIMVARPIKPKTERASTVEDMMVLIEIRLP